MFFIFLITHSNLRDELVEKQKVRIRNAEASGDGHCYNCGRLFMAVFNPPVQCYLCKHEFCRMCMEKMPKSKELICKFCRFESVHRGRLGVWFTEELKVARAQGRVRGVSGPEALRSSLLRLKRISPCPSYTTFPEETGNASEMEPDYGHWAASVPEPAPSIDRSLSRTSLDDLEIPFVNVRDDGEDLDTTYQRNAKQLEQKEASIRSKGEVSVSSVAPREEQPTDKSEWMSPRVSIEHASPPLKTSTVSVSRNKMSFGEFEASEGEPKLQSLDVVGQETPIKSASRVQKSYESELRTPDDTELLSEPSFIGMLQGDLTGAEAESHLAARRRFRRVRYLDSRGSMESLPMGSDSGYGPPRTENWVNEAQKEHDQSSNVSRKPPPGPPSDSSYERTPSAISERPPGSVASVSRPATPSQPRPDLHSSFSDLRSHGHKPRLSSEAGSKSTLSLASKLPTVFPSHCQGSPMVTYKASIQPVFAQPGDERQTLTEKEFGELGPLNMPDDHVTKANSLRYLSPHSHARGTGSMLSIYSERESSYTHGIAITGDLRLDIRYDTQSSTLRIAVKQARDLAIADKKHQACNPYVKAYLLPDKTKGSKRKTSYKKHTRNPVFEEELKYHIPYSELSERSLQISVWHKASVGTNLFLGEVIIPFADFSFDAGANWYPLSERRQIALSPSLQIFRGELLLALKLVPGGTMGRQSELHVWIKSAKGLSTSTTGRSKSSTVDPYCKIYILPDKAKNSKRKTAVVKKSNNPEWNTNFVYQNIDRTQLNGMGLEISIWDHDRLSSNDFLGGCRLNNGNMSQRWMDATGTEQSVWIAMMERPQTWFEGLIRLRANLD
ncbi:unnamed protein product [Echinostoma caproni]|uniref:RabBD domain-containing protein n=1 Tax=Echinostoma caproni TaxID=27848 RepID=A0A183A729_9TREM|nr:unnamed protein product [Echinostoma caproni]